MSETLFDKVERLRELTKEPARVAMSRSHQFPTMAAQHIANEKEIVTLRSALSEAVGLLEGYLNNPSERSR